MLSLCASLYGARDVVETQVVLLQLAAGMRTGIVCTVPIKPGVVASAPAAECILARVITIMICTQVSALQAYCPGGCSDIGRAVNKLLGGCSSPIVRCNHSVLTQRLLVRS